VTEKADDSGEKEDHRRRGKTDGGYEDDGCGGQRNPTRSDTMLGIDKLYFIGAKGHIYIHVQVCKYAGNPLTGGKNYNIQIYIYNNPYRPHQRYYAALSGPLRV
jgi:hypothetical protein